jgi:PIN domain nuclease of toxin-antitoxin system
MDVLLDTCSALWYFSGNDEIPQTARDIILNSDNTILISIASIWEVAIKISIGKLSIDGGIEGFIEAIEDEGFALLEVKIEHIMAVKDLPFHHRDPFDRMLIAQAITEGVSIMTTDSDVLKYNINQVW